MSNKCSYRLTSGRFCKRWANRGHGFCDVHQADPAPEIVQGMDYGVARYKENDVSVPALARLATPRDLFDVVRESINAVRLGRMEPAQAFAISALAGAWVRARNELNYDDRRRMLRQQMLPTLAEEDRLADDDLESSPSPMPPSLTPPSLTPPSPAPPSPAPPPARCHPESASAGEGPAFAPASAVPSSARCHAEHSEASAFASASAVPSSARCHAEHSEASAFASASVSSSEISNLKSVYPEPANDGPRERSEASAPASASRAQISNVESEMVAILTAPFQQIDLVAAHKAHAEKMGWVPDDGSDLQPLPITPRSTKPASRSG